MKVKEIVLVGPYRFEQREVKAEPLTPGKCLVAPKVVTICTSELKYYLGQKDSKKLEKRLPMALGHECCGEIVEAPEGEGFFAKGDRVLIIPAQFCGRCQVCREGRENFCQHAIFMASTGPGAMRTMFPYPSKLLRKLPPQVSMEVAALIEPLSIGFRAIKDAGLKRGMRVGIVGAGRMGTVLGLVVSHYAVIPRNRLFIFDQVERSLESSSGRATTINVASQVDEFIELRGKFDVVFEVVGTQETVQLACNLTRNMGTTAVLGLCDNPTTVYHNGFAVRISPNLTQFVNTGEEKVMGSKTLRGCSRSKIEDYDVILRGLSKDPGFRMKVQNLLHEEFFQVDSPESAKTAFDHAHLRGGSRKVVMYLNGCGPQKKLAP